MIKNLIRSLLFFPIILLNKLLVIYSKIVSNFDPNGFECKLEELYQKQIDSKTNKELHNQNINYKPNLLLKKKRIIFYTPNKITNYRANTLFTKEEDTIKWIDQYGGKNNIFLILEQTLVYIPYTMQNFTKPKFFLLNLSIKTMLY